jgi:DNA-3-methyladenine glycosylase II
VILDTRRVTRPLRCCSVRLASSRTSVTNCDCVGKQILIPPRSGTSLLDGDLKSEEDREVSTERISRSGPARQATSFTRGRDHLRKADPVIGHLIEERPDFNPYAWLDELPPMDLFGSLLFQVAGQQLSVAATRRIVGRVISLFGGHMPSPNQLSVADPNDLRAAGLSWRKVSTLRDLANRFVDGRLSVERLRGMSDDEFIAELTAVPGIGPWTAQGALLVALRREDIVLPGDLALRKAIREAYRLSHLPTQAEVLEIAEKWRPYRSLATSYLFATTHESDEPGPRGSEVEG